MMTVGELTQCLESATYRFAKTMPEHPHWYTLRQTWANDGLFDAVVLAIRHYGERRAWKPGRKFVYFDAGGYMYWTMGCPLGQTILINRAEIPPVKQEL
jgi:hypothetical protein